MSPLAVPTAASGDRSAAPAMRAIDGMIFARILVDYPSAERSVDDSEMMVAGGEVHAGEAEHLPKLFGRYRHRSGGGSAARRGLGESRGHRGVEGDVALDFLHHLVNVPIEHGDRAEGFEDREGLGAVLGA